MMRLPLEQEVKGSILELVKFDRVLPRFLPNELCGVEAQRRECESYEFNVRLVYVIDYTNFKTVTFCASRCKANRYKTSSRAE